MRWDSPFVLATAGTLAIHLILAVGGDALVVLYPRLPDPPAAPRIEIVDIEVPPVIKPPPPPVKKVEEPVKEAPKPATVVHHVQPTQHVEPPPDVPPPVIRDPEPSGGAPVISEPDIAPGATGVAVARGPRNTGHVGRGGTGTGTGSGVGSGTTELPPPVSVATIKTRAMPKGDYAYGVLKDYPAEAKQLGIEGAIRVKLVVDEHGAVKSAVLLNRLGHGLDELALRQANLMAFDPAKDTDDRPVSSVVVWTFDLTLPK